MSGQAGKKGKKKSKGKTVSLNAFLGDTQQPGMVKQIDWADEAEEETYRSVSSSLTYQSSSYQSSSTPKIIQLPTAPRAARSVEVDHSRIPETGPFTAFVGNLPYEVDQFLLEEFFKDLPVVNVRLPEENGRFKGFGYVQFGDRQSLIKALEMNEETLQKRNIRIDIADNQNKEGGGGFGRSGGDRYGSQSSGPDPTEGNWRSKPAEEDSSRQTNYDDRRSSYRNDDYRKGSRDYDGYDRRQGYSNRGYEDRNRSDDRSRYGNDRGYERPRYGGSGGYDKPRNDSWDRPRSDEPPKERPTLRLQPRQKPIEGNTEATTRSSSIFGAAKPVDTTAKERAIEEKIHKQQKSVEEVQPTEKRSSNIFGQAKPIDTSAREREMEEKLAAQKEKLSSSNIFGQAKPIDTSAREREMEEKLAAQKEKLSAATKQQPTVSARASVFGDAKPVDTSAKEREMEEKLKKMQENVLSTANRDDRDSDKRSRISSQRSDDYVSTSPRRSRNSSVKSDEHSDGASTQKSTSESQDSRKSTAPQYRPAPIPKQNAWGKKITSAEKPPSSVATAKQEDDRDDAQKAPKMDQRGEREEAEGSREEEEERMPEGAADEERAIASRNEPGDGSEEKYNSSRRDAPRYRPDHPTDSYQARGKASKYDAGRGRNSNDGHREARRRVGDGDSQSYRGGQASTNSSGRGKRDVGGRNKTRNEWTDKRRDSSRDSRPECDRVDGAGQEQPTNSSSRVAKSKPRLKQVEKEVPVDFVQESKFALLSVDSDNDDDIN